MPRCDSFNLFICGCIASVADVICNEYKNEKEFIKGCIDIFNGYFT